MPASGTQILVVVVCLVVIAGAIALRTTVRRKVYESIQRSDKPKSAIQKFLGW